MKSWGIEIGQVRQFTYPVNSTVAIIEDGTKFVISDVTSNGFGCDIILIDGRVIDGVSTKNIYIYSKKCQ